jgi:hypothetical protein
MSEENKYDVALSFAGEDRRYVDKVAEFLRANNVRVFYDMFEEAELWGKDLGVHFEFVYRRGAKYCIPFISEHYKKKVWANWEIKNAISKAIETGEDYILPARFDDTEIDGLRTSLAFIDLRKYEPEEFGSIILKKLGQESNVPEIQKLDVKVADVYLSQNILVSQYKGVFGATIGVDIVNQQKETRYFTEPYFETSHPVVEGADTFYLLDKSTPVSFPVKLEWGEPFRVDYNLKVAAINQWKTLPNDATLKAIVHSTVGEKIVSNEVKLVELTKHL